MLLTETQVLAILVLQVVALGTALYAVISRRRERISFNHRLSNNDTLTIE